VVFDDYNASRHPLWPSISQYSTMPLPVDPESPATSSAKVASSGSVASPASAAPSRQPSASSEQPAQTSPDPTSAATESSLPSATEASPVQSASQTSLRGSSTSKPMVVVPKPTTSSQSTISASFWASAPVTLVTTSTSRFGSSSISATTITTSIIVGGRPTPASPLPQDPSSGLISALPKESSNSPTAPKKHRGSSVAGVAGGVTAVVLCAFLGLFLWRWRVRRRWNASKRLSFGPHGNGIDASRGNVLVSSVACMPGESMSVGESHCKDFTILLNAPAKMQHIVRTGY
jgi:hypothetical protein